MLPDNLAYEDLVCVTPRVKALNWLNPAIFTPSDGSIFLVNSSSQNVTISKDEHLADVRSTVTPDQILLLNLYPAKLYMMTNSNSRILLLIEI